MAFKLLKPHVNKQCTEGLCQFWGIFALVIPNAYVGKMHVLLDEANHHWGSCLFMEYNILYKWEASSILFFIVGEIAISQLSP